VLNSQQKHCVNVQELIKNYSVITQTMSECVENRREFMFSETKWLNCPSCTQSTLHTWCVRHVRKLNIGLSCFVLCNIIIYITADILWSFWFDGFGLRNN